MGPGSHVECLLTSEDSLTCLGVSPDSSLIAAAGQRCSLMLYDVAARRVTSTRNFPDDFGPVDIVFSPDGAHLAVRSGITGGGSDFIYAMSIESGERHSHIHSDVYRRREAFSADSRQLYTAGVVGGTVEIWNLLGSR